MASDSKETSYIGDKIDQTGDTKRKRHTVMMTDSDWKAITNEASRRGLDRSEVIRQKCFKNVDVGRGRISQATVESQIPEELKREALIAILHLYELFKTTFKKDVFDETRKAVTKRLRISGLRD
jgi:hypothetical protein